MNSNTIKSRVAQLKAMHELMLNANDERIYMARITGWIPDEPIEEDFVNCAEDDEQYNETYDLFVELIVKRGNRF